MTMKEILVKELMRDGGTVKFESTPGNETYNQIQYVAVVDIGKLADFLIKFLKIKPEDIIKI